MQADEFFSCFAPHERPGILMLGVNTVDFCFFLITSLERPGLLLLGVCTCRPLTSCLSRFRALLGVANVLLTCCTCRPLT
jgi:hypothetical protein